MKGEERAAVERAVGPEGPGGAGPRLGLVHSARYSMHHISNPDFWSALALFDAANTIRRSLPVWLNPDVCS